MKILSICGSPRKGNSEAILLRLQKLFKKAKIDNEIILLRQKKINRCQGCVEYCNKHLKCCHHDDMAKILQQMLKADGYVFALPNYFAMPPGLFKDFIDKCSIFYTSYYFTKKPDLSNKKAAIIIVGTDQEFIDACRDHLAKWFCEAGRIKVVTKKSFRSRSELKGNYNDIFENNLNPTIEKDLQKIVKSFQKLLEVIEKSRRKEGNC